MAPLARRSDGKLPRYWLHYVVVLVVFTGMIGFLIYLGVDPLLAISVPATLSMVADSVLVRLSTLHQTASPATTGAEESAPESLPPVPETGSKVA